MHHSPRLPHPIEKAIGSNHVLVGLLQLDPSLAEDPLEIQEAMWKRISDRHPMPSSRDRLVFDGRGGHAAIGDKDRFFFRATFSPSTPPIPPLLSPRRFSLPVASLSPSLLSPRRFLHSRCFSLPVASSTAAASPSQPALPPSATEGGKVKSRTKAERRGDEDRFSAKRHTGMHLAEMQSTVPDQTSKGKDNGKGH